MLLSVYLKKLHCAGGIYVVLPMYKKVFEKLIESYADGDESTIYIDEVRILDTEGYADIVNMYEDFDPNDYFRDYSIRQLNSMMEDLIDFEDEEIGLLNMMLKDGWDFQVALEKVQCAKEYDCIYYGCESEEGFVKRFINSGKCDYNKLMECLLEDFMIINYGDTYMIIE